MRFHWRRRCGSRSADDAAQRARRLVERDARRPAGGGSPRGRRRASACAGRRARRCARRRARRGCGRGTRRAPPARGSRSSSKPRSRSRSIARPRLGVEAVERPRRRGSRSRVGTKVRCRSGPPARTSVTVRRPAGQARRRATGATSARTSGASSPSPARTARSRSTAGHSWLSRAASATASVRSRGRAASVGAGCTPRRARRGPPRARGAAPSFRPSCWNDCSSGTRRRVGAAQVRGERDARGGAGRTRRASRRRARRSPRGASARCCSTSSGGALGCVSAQLEPGLELLARALGLASRSRAARRSRSAPRSRPRPRRARRSPRMRPISSSASGERAVVAQADRRSARARARAGCTRARAGRASSGASCEASRRSTARSSASEWLEARDAVVPERAPHQLEELLGDARARGADAPHVHAQARVVRGAELARHRRRAASGRTAAPTSASAHRPRGGSRPARPRKLRRELARAATPRGTPPGAPRAPGWRRSRAARAASPRATRLDRGAARGSGLARRPPARSGAPSFSSPEPREQRIERVRELGGSASRSRVRRAGAPRRSSARSRGARRPPRPAGPCARAPRSPRRRPARRSRSPSSSPRASRARWPTATRVAGLHVDRPPPSRARAARTCARALRREAKARPSTSTRSRTSAEVVEHAVRCGRRAGGAPCRRPPRAASPPRRGPRGARGSATSPPRTRAGGTARRRSRGRSRWPSRGRDRAPPRAASGSAKKLRRALRAVRAGTRGSRPPPAPRHREAVVALARRVEAVEPARIDAALAVVGGGRAPRSGSPCWWRRPRSRGRSPRARQASRARASSRLRPIAITFAISESKRRGTTWLPAATPRVDAQARAERRVEARDAAGRRQEARVGILGADARLDRVAALLALHETPSVSPRAMRIWSCTRSRPVIASVMPCSTWRRGFISRKWKAPRATRNSTVPTPS